MVKRSRIGTIGLFAPAVLGLVIWRLSLLRVDANHLGSYGLPPALPFSWYCSLAIAIVGATTAIVARGSSALLMVAYITLVALILFGTVAVISAPAHYAWVYKHIGVVRYLEAHGAVNPGIDIYNRWPGFFAVAAVFSTVGGRVNPETYANWAEFFFLLTDALLVIATVRALVSDIRVAAGAGLLFVVTNWVGQTYFSPQAFAFTLFLGLILVMVRQLLTDSSSYSTRVVRTLDRLGRMAQRAPDVSAEPRWPRGAAIAVVLGLDAVIVASHQLTPYMLLVSVALLMAAGIVRPWWPLAVMGLMTFGYLAANFSFIQDHYGLFTSIDPFNNVQGSQITPNTPVAGKVFNTNCQLVLIAIFWIAGVLSVLRLLRRGLLARALPFLILAASPFVVVFGQSYGGEAPLRIILFSSPWFAALISWALATVGRPLVRWVLTSGLALALAALFVPSFLGQEELNIVSPAEVAASEHFYYHARAGSVLVLAAPGFPYRYGATYAAFSGPEGDANPNLLTEPEFQNRQLGAADVHSIAARIREYTPHGYIVFSKDETAYAEIFRITPPGALRRLRAAVAASPHFRLWYSNEDTQIYELATPSAARSGAAGAERNADGGGAG